MGFDKIYKQEIAVNTILNGLSKNTLSQSLLFYGEPFSGKLTTALSLAKALNCPNTSNPYFCDECKVCDKIERFSYPDVFVIDSDIYYIKLKQIVNLIGLVNFDIVKKRLSVILNRFFSRLTAEYFSLRGSFSGKRLSKNNMIDILSEYQYLINTAKDETDLYKAIDKKVKSKSFLENINLIENFHNLNIIPIQTIKNIMDKMNLSISEGKKKVIIFNGIELMKKEGSNAFLKSIEEPPKNSQIILITSNLNKILPTIKSRCYLIPFSKRSIDDIKKVFSRVYKKDFEKIDVNKLNDIFSDYPQIIYKEYFFMTINMLSDYVINSHKTYSGLMIITDYSNKINDIIKSGSRKDIFIIKQVYQDIIHIIKLYKKGYHIDSMFSKYLTFLTGFEEDKLNKSINTIMRFFSSYDNHSLERYLEKSEENFNYIFYNNVEIDMGMTEYLVNLTKNLIKS
jgi:DNA polymerase III delta prime subunit